MADNQPPSTDAAAEATEAVAKLYLDDVTGEQVSKTELKKRQKARQNEAKKKEKAEKAAAANPHSAPKPKNTADAEKELTPNQVCRLGIEFDCNGNANRPPSTLRFARALSMSSTSRARLTLTRFVPYTCSAQYHANNC